MKLEDFKKQMSDTLGDKYVDGSSKMTTNRDRTGRQATEVMKYVTVLDFETGRVHMYTVDKNEWNPDEQSIEEFLQHVGHNLQNCEWMVHGDKRVVTSVMLTKENSFTK